MLLSRSDNKIGPDNKIRARQQIRFSASIRSRSAPGSRPCITSAAAASTAASAAAQRHARVEPVYSPRSAALRWRQRRAAASAHTQESPGGRLRRGPHVSSGR